MTESRDLRTTSDPQVIHILVGGRALCGKRGVPREWDAGHLWVRMNDAMRATCARCRDAARDTIMRQFSDRGG